MGHQLLQRDSGARSSLALIRIVASCEGFVNCRPDITVRQTNHRILRGCVEIVDRGELRGCPWTQVEVWIVVDCDVGSSRHSIQVCVVVFDR